MYTGDQLTQEVTDDWRSEMMRVIVIVERCAKLPEGALMHHTRKRGVLKYRQFAQYYLVGRYTHYKVRKAFEGYLHWDRGTISHSVGKIRNHKVLYKDVRDFVESLEKQVNMGLYVTDILSN